MAKLTIKQAMEIVDSYVERRAEFPIEDSADTLLMVLLNYGDHLTKVNCINGEWEGQKKDLAKKSGFPTCPNGHPVTEAIEQWRLGLVLQ